jgi:hypothetical protein
VPQEQRDSGKPAFSEDRQTMADNWGVDRSHLVKVADTGWQVAGPVTVRVWDGACVHLKTGLSETDVRGYLRGDAEVESGSLTDRIQGLTQARITGDGSMQVPNGENASIYWSPC